MLLTKQQQEETEKEEEAEGNEEAENETHAYRMAVFICSGAGTCDAMRHHAMYLTVW